VQDTQTVSTHPALTFTIEVSVQGVELPMLVLPGEYEYAPAQPEAIRLQEVMGQEPDYEF
jgi:hypothetical protein